MPLKLPDDLPEGYCTRGQLARLLGVTPPRVSQAITEGKIENSAIKEFKGKTYLVKQIAMQQWSDAYTGKGPTKASLSTTLGDRDNFFAPIELPENNSEESSDRKLAVNRSRDNEIIYKSKLIEIKYNEAIGLLVNRQTVDRALFEFAREMRDKFGQLPARTIDYILAAKTRHEAVEILTVAIGQVLQDLAEIPNRLNQKIDG
jgi:hypothetical protein